MAMASLTESPLYRHKSIATPFDESKHPRADDGTFGSGNSSKPASQEPFPEFAKNALVKDWKTAKKRGVTDFIKVAPTMAKEVVKEASNWIGGSLESAADYLAGQLIHYAAINGSRDLAVRYLANYYDQRASGASEPGQSERFAATARGLRKLEKRSLAASPLYVRKSIPGQPAKPDEPGFTGTDKIGHRWVNGKQVAIGKDAGGAPVAPGKQPPQQPPAGASSYEKAGFWADRLKQKFGNGASAAVDSMAAKLKGAADPDSQAKLAALEAVKAHLEKGKLDRATFAGRDAEGLAVFHGHANVAGPAGKSAGQAVPLPPKQIAAQKPSPVAPPAADRNADIARIQAQSDLMARAMQGDADAMAELSSKPKPAAAPPASAKPEPKGIPTPLKPAASIDAPPETAKESAQRFDAIVDPAIAKLRAYHEAESRHKTKGTVPKYDIEAATSEIMPQISQLIDASPNKRELATALGIPGISTDEEAKRRILLSVTKRFGMMARANEGAFDAGAPKRRGKSLIASPLCRVKSLDAKKTGDADDSRESIMADIIAGWEDKHGGVTKAGKWEESKHPRDGGKFATKPGAGAKPAGEKPAKAAASTNAKPNARQAKQAAAKAAVGKIIAGNVTPEAHAELITHLHAMTIPQLKALRAEHGFKASGTRKADIVNHIAGHFKQKMIATGSVDVGKLSDALKPHESHNLSSNDVRFAKAEYENIKEQYGTLTMHRIESAANEHLEALEDLPKGAKEDRSFHERKLAAAAWMLDRAKKDGITGQVEDPSMKDFGANVARIQLGEKLRGSPWSSFLIHAIRDKFDVGSDKSDHQIWENLKDVTGSKYKGERLDAALKILRTDYGTVTQEQLRKLLPKLKGPQDTISAAANRMAAMTPKPILQASAARKTGLPSPFKGA